MEKQFKRVGTHSGKFHADEVMSTAILKILYDLEITRSRDPEILKELDIVYDVGDGEFDHHQVEKKFRENGTPYAACGLIWERFGREVVKAYEPALSEDEVEDVFYFLDEMMIEGIDAADNGIRTCATIIPTMNISSIIAEFNPPWDSEKEENNVFHEAVRFASAVFRNTLDQRISVIKARSNVIEAYSRRIRPEVLMLERSYPWTQALYEIDTNMEVLFVIYPRNEEYLIQTVRKNDGTYGDRKRLPRAWAGKREEELSRLIGIEDAVFCHSARFIAGAKSLESVLKMADLAITELEPIKLQTIESRSFVRALKRFLLKKSILIKR